MKGESMSALKLARLICEHAEDVHDDIDMGTVTSATVKAAKAMREETMALVDKLMERGRL